MFDRLINNKSAFSMVEMMLLLLIASLIVAASVPLITRKHLNIPSASNHGSYMCYYQNGKLMEARRSGRVQQKLLSGYPRETANCVFEPPAKAAMFQITAIGGGGGGGDAGYDGKLPTSHNRVEQTLDPFPEQSDGDHYLKLENLSKIGIDINNEDAVNEVKNYFANFWVYAAGSDSSLPGSIYYTKLSKGKETNACPAGQLKYEEKEKVINLNNVEYKLCSGEGVSGGKTVLPDIYVCYRKKAYSSERVKVGGYYKYPSGPEGQATCSKKQNVVVDCTWPNGKTKKELVTVTVTKEVPAVYRTTGTYLKETKKVNVPCQSNNACQSLNQTNCDNTAQTLCTEYQDVYENCAEGIEKCLISGPTSKEITRTVEMEVEIPCTNQYEQKTDTWTERAPSSIVYFGEDFNKDDPQIQCDKVSSSSGEVVHVTYTTHELVGCNINTETDKPNYSIAEEKSRNLTAGRGAFCLSASQKGSLGLRYQILRESPYEQLPIGDDINKRLSISSPHSFCGAVMCAYSSSPSCRIGSCGPSKGNYHPGNPTMVKLGNTTIFARNSTTPAKGAKLKQDSMILNVFDGYIYDSSGLASGIKTKPITYYFDTLDNTSVSNGVNGTCSQNSAEYSQDRDCRGDSSRKAGYCMQHVGFQSAEENGLYHFYDTYETNSLPKGLSGEPGEYKTLVVRSLSGADRTIVVGRGGSAATLNLGGDGSRGSDTSFGDFLIAKGGEGGKGRQSAIADVELPPYDSSWDFRKVMTCFTSLNLNNLSDADRVQCESWRNNPSDVSFYKNTSDVSDKIPIKVISGGMFSHVMSTFGVGGNDSLAADLTQFAGKAGNGGGVEHFCWAGQRKIYFEGHELEKSGAHIPEGCHNAFRNIPATSGGDGAVIISW